MHRGQGYRVWFGFEPFEIIIFRNITSRDFDPADAFVHSIMSRSERVWGAKSPPGAKCSDFKILCNFILKTW